MTSINMQQLESSIDRICELVDQLRAQRTVLLAALKVAQEWAPWADHVGVPPEIADAIARVEAAIEDEAKL